MPVSILNTDTSFPRFSGTETNRQQMETVLNYLFMLREELKYTLANIGEENFNDAGLEAISNMITEPVYVRLSDTEGAVATLQVTAGSLSSRITNAEGNVSSLQQTATSLSSRITGLDQSVSTISQSVNSIYLSVSNGNQSSTISLYKDGVAISSQNIVIKGMVTFTDLSSEGFSTINGANITTGTISAISIESCDVSASVFSCVLTAQSQVSGELKFYYKYLGIDSYLAGGIRLDDGGSGSDEDASYRMYLYTQNTAGGRAFALKLYSDYKISMEAEEYIYIGCHNHATMEAAGEFVIRCFDALGGGDIYLEADSGIYLNGDVYVNGRLIS